MNDEAQLRLGVFIVMLLLMASLEALLAFRKSPGALAQAGHWLTNLAISLINTTMLRLLFPAGLVAIALWADKNQLGGFNQFSLNNHLELLAGLVLLDLAIYWQHRLMHTVPLLWKLHGVHHSDQWMDFSTGFRFHPLEILLSFFIKVALVLALGISPACVVIFELVLSSFALFTHGNLIFPQKIERAVGKIFVTPAMHRVHHSVDLHESNKNFCFSINFWDRLFSSYQKPEQDQSSLVFGRVTNQERVNSNTPLAILFEPFKK